jgi:hypothetical protein
VLLQLLYRVLAKQQQQQQQQSNGWRPQAAGQQAPRSLLIPLDIVADSGAASQQACNHICTVLPGLALSVASYSPSSLPSASSAGEYLLNVLIIAKPTYKGLIVPGGKVDMMFTAKGFGKEDGERTVT